MKSPYNHRRLERKLIELLLLKEVVRGLADVVTGRTRDAREALVARQRSLKRLPSADGEGR